jgi:hypothetical protein
MLRRRFCSGSMAGKVSIVGVYKTPPQAFSPGPSFGAFLCAANALRTRPYCRRLLTDSRASRCSMNKRRLDSKADSACTASDVRAPAARSRAIRLFCSATVFCASHTRRWASARGSSSSTMLPRRAGEVRWHRVRKLGRLTLEVRAAAQGSES